MIAHFTRFALACVSGACATSASAEFLQIDIIVHDPVNSTFASPVGDTRWIIEGAGDFLLAEQHGAMPSMSFDLPPGDYRVTVWELTSGAAAEDMVTLPESGRAQVALILSPMNERLIANIQSRTNEP